jgi:hypothetical protein
MTEQEQIWQELSTKFANATDGLGMGIDPGIFEAVVALNALGIRTTDSCEGHLENGSPAPWIDVEAHITKEEEGPSKLAWQKVQEEEELQRLPKEEIWRLYREARKLEQPISRKHLQERAKVMHYLAAFYAERNVPYDRRITIQGLTLQGIAGYSRLESQGSGLLHLYSTDERAEKLQEYQAEMQAFARFLKETFFGSSENKRPS